MPEIKKADLKSMNISEDKLRQLKQVLPEVFTEGLKIDLEKLKIAIGENAELGKERFGMTWPGKADCFKIIQAPSVATLVPEKSESVNFDTTENLFIEGDNLEVLKLLQKSCYGKVKMIYIDPPYNTGKEFIYPDNYSESLDTYLRYSGQIDNQGRKYSTNAETEGRFHSKWLCMMYSRLYLARNLLADDGVIFVSIDDCECDSAKKIMNEIFGEECFLGQVVRATGTTTGQDSGGFGKSFDYLLCYSKNIDFELTGIPLDEEDEKRFSDEDAKGKYSVLQLRKTGNADRRGDRPSMYYPVTAPDGAEVYPIGPGGYESRWRFGQDKYQECLGQDLIVWKQVEKNGDKVYQPYVKFYLEGRTKRPSPLWDDIDGNKKATIELRELLGEKVFDNPKPTQVIKRLIQICFGDRKNGVVLDFFAGSGTTGHAVIDFNRQNGTDIKFICVQLPEIVEQHTEAFKAGFRTIADVSKERIRRAIKKVEKEAGGQLNFSSTIDLGFKVFKLTQSNFKVWDGDAETKKEAVEKQLEMHVDHINPKSSQEDILFELLLKAGFELTTKIEKISIAGKTVYSIEGGLMLICLENELTQEVIKAMAEKNPSRVICLDQGFEGNDQLKTNAVQIMKSKGVEDFRTV